MEQKQSIKQSSEVLTSHIYGFMQAVNVAARGLKVRDLRPASSPGGSKLSD